jgi:cysteine-rich repeat protein
VALLCASGCGRPVTEPPRCGDGRIDPGEVCDDGDDNSDNLPGACRTDCRPARCGDGVVDPNESCDGTNLAGASCGSLGYYGGSLACRLECELDRSSCEEAGWCGDGSIQPDEGEECDDGNEVKDDGCEECMIVKFRIDVIDLIEGSLGADGPTAVAVTKNGRAVVAWRDYLPSGYPYTIAYRVIPPSGTMLHGEYLFFPGRHHPSEDGFKWPDVVVVEGETSTRTLFVFQECSIGGWCLTELDGSSTGVFLAELPSIEEPEPQQINTYTTGDQALPRLTAGQSGEAVVVWQSDGQDGSGWGVYAQAYSQDGTPLGPEIRVNEATTGDQMHPDVAMLEDGGYVVVWESFDEAEVSQGVLMRRFDPNGTPRSAETPVAEDLPVDPGQQGPRVAAGVDGFVVVWQGWAVDGDGWGVFGRMFSTGGTPKTGALELAEQWQDDQSRPAVAMDGSGSFVAVWEDRSSGDRYLRGRRFDISGQAMGPEMEISRDKEWGDSFPEIAMTPDGRFVVVWVHYCQRFLPDGTPIGLAPW